MIIKHFPFSWEILSSCDRHAYYDSNDAPGNNSPSKNYVSKSIVKRLANQSRFRERILAANDPSREWTVQKPCTRVYDISIKFFNDTQINLFPAYTSVYNLSGKFFPIVITADWDYGVRKLIFTRVSVLIKRRVAVISVILIIALHNYRAHRFAICTRLTRSPHGTVPIMEPNGREKVIRINAINSQVFARGSKEKGGILFIFVIDATKFFDDLVGNLECSPRAHAGLFFYNFFHNLHIFL